MSGGELNATQIHALLQEHGRRLQARGVDGDVKLVGGAALILQGIGNRPTVDIDASYADKPWSTPPSLKWQTTTSPPTGSTPTPQPSSLDIARLLRRLNITNAADAVDLAYDKYGEPSIPLAAGRDNYLIVVDDALDAAATLKPED